MSTTGITPVPVGAGCQFTPALNIVVEPDVGIAAPGNLDRPRKSEGDERHEYLLPISEQTNVGETLAGELGRAAS